MVGALGFLGFLDPDFSFSSDPAPDSPGDGSSPTASGRDPLLWPFSRDSIWNLPIGASASYVHAGIRKATAYGMTTDVDVLILTPNAPLMSVYYNDDAWSTVPGRCNAEGGVQFSAPIPSGFIVLGNGGGNPHGTTPNYATAILDADGVTLIQGQPYAHCTADGAATIWWFQRNERIDGRGNSGGHGGSMLSSIGGTIRLGELVPDGIIRHAMKLNLNGANYYGGLGGYRWPATTKDSCAPGCYGGSIPEMRMGSLLALKPDFDFNQLETEPAKILAQGFQDYGAYAADNAGWSVYGIDTEYSPSGDVMVEFENRWGFSMTPASRDVPWARDMDRIFLALHVVDDWDEALWNVVSLSNGTLGVGEGLPRVAWAPEFGEAPPVPDPDQIPPVTSASLSGTAGSSDWYRSPVTVTLAATDEGSGVASVHVRIDGGAWALYASPVTITGEGRHTVEYYAKDVAGNDGAVQSVTFGVDTIAPTTTSALGGTPGGQGWYRSRVTVALTAADSHSGVQQIQVRTDGGAWTAYASPFTISSEGSHTVEHYATDVAGNTESVVSLTFRIDSLAPITAYSLSGTLGALGWYVSLTTVTLTATSANGSAASAAYRLDGGQWVAYSIPFSLTEGSHVLEYQATDSGGHVEPLQSITIGVDYTPPSVARAGTSGAIPSDGTLSWIGADAVSGIVRYEVSADGGPFRSVSLETSINGPWTIGEHVAVVKAIDAAGNVGTTTINFRVEGAAPPQDEPLPNPLSRTGATLYAIIAGLVALSAALWYIPRRRETRSHRSPKGGREPGSDDFDQDSSSIDDDEIDEF